MPSLHSSAHRHRCGRVLALLLVLVACSDDGPTAPTVPVPTTANELAGLWYFSDSSVVTTGTDQTVCRDRGALIFAAGVTSTFADLRYIGTCVSPRGTGGAFLKTETEQVRVVADSIFFTVSSGAGSLRDVCDYRGRLTGGSSLGASGSLSCSRGKTGTWQVSWGPPAAAEMGKLSMIDIGSAQTCALAESGETFCWGMNTIGELGTGDDLPRLVPARVTGGMRFTQISVSNEGGFVCGLTSAGAAYCWGNSWGGRLGDGSGAEQGKAVMSPQPVVGGHTFKQIAAAGNHTCAITTDGKAYCWGYNLFGELGTGNETPSSTPVAVSGGLTFKQIDTYTNTSCGVTTSGNAYCWGGEGWSGILGNGDTSDSNVPVPVQGGLTWASVSVGLWMACGVTTSGDGYCWGQDWGTGALGTGAAEEERTTPALVTGGMKWKSISAGVGVACGVTVTNVGYCWGDGSFGTLGAGVDRKGAYNTPIPIAGGLAFDHVVADWHACGMTTAGVAYCWSAGDYGVIGDGDLRLRWAPAKVAGQK